MGLKHGRNSPLSHRHRFLFGAVCVGVHSSLDYMGAVVGWCFDCPAPIKWRKFFGGNDLGSPGLPREA